MKRVVTVVAVVGLLAVLMVQWIAHRKTRSELAASSNQLVQARAENERLRQSQVDAQNAEAAANQKEILQLRNRIAQLAKESRQHSNMATQKSLNATPTTSAEQTQRNFPFLKTGVTNRVPTGQTLLVGGWTDPNGKRAFFFATPSITDANDAQHPNAIQLKIQPVQADEDFWRSVGWADVKAGGSDDSLSALLTSDQVQSLLQALKQTAGAELTKASDLRIEDNKGAFAWSWGDDNGVTVLLAADVRARPTLDRRFVDLEITPPP